MTTQTVPKVLSSESITGNSVVNPQGEDLGNIKDVMLDVPSGRVAYAVLTFGGFLGMGNKLFAVPWNALQVDPDHHRFILNVDKEALKDAPGFDKDNWPGTDDVTWQHDVHRFYRVKPYWETR